MSHTGPDKPAFDQLSILTEYGVSPEAFIWTHAQHGTLEGWVRAARMGSWVALDGINENRINEYVSHLASLKAHELLDRVLISHDSGWYRVGEANGGRYRGYTTIYEVLIPALQEKGFMEEDIELLLVKNPAKAFAINIRLL
jgi:phosphotriesterase-related protein